MVFAIFFMQLRGLNSRQLPCLAFADYDVAPHGFYDFYDAVQMFCSNNILGLGIGNVDRDYPMFAIPDLRSFAPSIASKFR
jgi:hypothetical protein